MIFPNTTTLFIPLRSPNHSTTSYYHTRPSNETSPARYHHLVTEQYRSLQVPPRLHAFSSSSSSTTTPRNDTGSNHTPFKRLETMTTSSDSGSKSPISNSSFSITTATTVKTEFNDQQLFVSPSLSLPIEVPLRATQVATEMRVDVSGEEAKPLEEKPLVLEWQVEGYQSGIVDEDELFVIPSEEEDEEEMVKQKSRQVHSIEEDEDCFSMFMEQSPSSSASSMFSGSTSFTNPSIGDTSLSFDSELEQFHGGHHHNLTDNGTRRTVVILDTNSVHSSESHPHGHIYTCNGTTGTTGTGQTYYHKEDRYSMRRSRFSSSGSRSLDSSGHRNAEFEGGYDSEYEHKNEVESDERSTFKLQHTLNHPYKFYAYRNTPQSCAEHQTIVPFYSYSHSYSSPSSSFSSDPGIGPVTRMLNHSYSQRLQELSCRSNGNNVIWPTSITQDCGCRGSPEEGRFSDNSPFPVHPRAPAPQEEILGIPDSELSSSSSPSYPTEIDDTSTNHTYEVRWFLSNSNSSSSNGHCAPADTLYHHRHNPSQNAFKPPFSASVPISQPSYSGLELNIISQVGVCGSLGDRIRTAAAQQEEEEEEEGLIKIISTTSITVNNKATTVSSIPDPGLVPILTGDPGFNITAGHVTLAPLVES
ncbi:hypothetical protein K435DRAFT_860216 [Dendrothele bispora CBS 962.96]|uniref:Uncharacterized protein n=1 Tax=Dendrothele bispora (strain CBS 962.96) TaxID=1314807 RepID=A0A4S8LZ21_DENBC|nr:hypothetical protein K435DRAFT_860216 [Dendrothele bispora CBS 962.96]